MSVVLNTGQKIKRDERSGGSFGFSEVTESSESKGWRPFPVPRRMRVLYRD